MTIINPYCDDCWNEMLVELEIDHGGKDYDNAEALLDIGNRYTENIYIKSDGSLDDGLEIVSHPMTINYHKT